MKSEFLLETLGEIDESYVKEAAAPLKRRRWGTWGALAACAALVIAAAAVLPGRLRSQTPPQPADPQLKDLPKLTAEQFFDTYGFEGYLAYSVDELADGSPWSEEAWLGRLPVFKNQARTDRAGMLLRGGDREALEAAARDAAARLGLEGLVYEEVLSEVEGFTGVWAVAGRGDGVTVTARADGEVQIEFEPGRTLPEGLNFSLDSSTCEEMQAVGEYLVTAYADLLQMERPAVSVDGGDRTFSGEGLPYRVKIYEGAGGLAQRLVSHALNSVSFSCDDEGKLWCIRMSCRDLSEVLGDYPIITAEQARELLLSGNYITSVPAAVPGEDRVVRTQLVYRAEPWAEVFMPYYRFLVELTNEELGFSGGAMAQGLKHYGAYYVPAVLGEYLTEMPVWDGSFN